MGMIQKTWKFTGTFFFFGVIFTSIFLPMYLKYSSDQQKLLQESAGPQIDELFRDLQTKDSLELWNENRSWMYEYISSTPIYIADYMHTNPLQFLLSSVRIYYEWYNYYSEQFLVVNEYLPEQAIISSRQNRESIRNFSEYCENSADYIYNDFLLYSNLFKNDKKWLSEFAQLFTEFPVISEDPKTEIAYNVISFVQSMQYIRMRHHRLKEDSLLCLGYQEYDYNADSIYWESDCNYCSPAVGPERSQQGRKIKHEVFSPIEFLFYGKGDCDSRTVLAYTLLDLLGYDVIIMRIQYYYAERQDWHSMLGIAGVSPSAFNYYIYQNKRYYFVELTQKNWRIGELTPEQKRYGRLGGVELPLPTPKWKSLN